MTSVRIADDISAYKVVLVDNAAGIVTGQIVSLGDKQYDNFHLTRTVALSGALVAGNKATLVISFAKEMRLEGITFIATVNVQTTLQSLGQWFVDQVNTQLTLIKLKISALKLRS